MAARVDVTQLRDEMFRLTYAEVAVAVAASPTGDGSPVETVRAGLAEIGHVEVRARAAASLRLAEVKHLGPGRQARRAARAAHTAMWGGTARFNRAHSIAERFWRQHGTRIGHSDLAAAA
jgi:hypothetical protein